MSDESERDRFLFDLINQRQIQELQRINDIDSKASNLLVFLTAVIGFLLGIANLTANSSKVHPYWETWLFVTGTLVLLAAMTITLLGYRIRKWQLVPNVKS